MLFVCVRERCSQVWVRCSQLQGRVMSIRSEISGEIRVVLLGFLTCPDWVIVLRSVNAASLHWSSLSCRPHFLQCELSLDLPPKTRANSVENTTVLCSETCSPRLLLFVLKTQFKNVILAYEILLQFKITVFYLNVFLKYHLFMWCKAVFSASLLQSPVSHDLQKSFYYLSYYQWWKRFLLRNIL